MDGIFAINLTPLVDTAGGLLAAVLTALAIWGAQRLMSWLKISEDEKVRAYLETAITNSIAWARTKLNDQAGSITVTTKNKVVHDAATYLVDRVPDALKRFGIDEAAARDLVLARLPALNSAAVTAPKTP